MTDVHYYLADWRPRNKKECDMFTCVGGNFHIIPGTYNLPFKEGNYMIQGDGQVRMQPRRSGDWYVHDHVMLTNIVNWINFGWYSLGHSFGHSGDFDMIKFAPSGYSTMHSI